MQTDVSKTLSRSAQDFKDIVWPQVSILPLLNGGTLHQIENVADQDFKLKLDILAGIDAWQVLHTPSAMCGIASRVQWGICRDSFSIRTYLPSGNETEFQKRLRAIENIDDGHLFPHLTVQAYLDRHQGHLIAAAVIRTKDLIKKASILVSRREKLKPSKLYGFIANPDGTEFLHMRWEYLQYKKILTKNDIVRPRPAHQIV